MPLRLYNTFAKREEEFVPLNKGKVSLYTCGPTVYGRPHIGNYSSFLMADLLRRWLEVSGYAVTHVKNITDVGHLVADADSGEDKVEREAKKEKVDPLEIARKYTEMYLEDEKALNMVEPEHRPRASEYVPQMIDIIKVLMEKGHAYETADGIYFSVESFPDYGKLSGNTLENLNAGSRIALDEDKKHPADFALWKKCVGENAHHILRWPSPWGEGFPGWHIECSAMSSALLGPEIDIHTGGEDNIFPHHECEIAQSECCTGNHPFVRIWLHKRRIDLLGEKMSKSLGNVLTIPDVLQKGFSALDFRFAFLSVHYRTNLKFSFDALENARKVRLKIVEWFEAVTTESADAVSDAKRGIDPKISEAIESFSAAMNSDLNTAGALGSLFTLMNYYYAVRTSKTLPSKEDFQELLSFIETARRTFGCFESESVEIPAEVHALVEQRAKARASKDFAESDRLRDEIKNLGFEVRDSGAEQTLKKI